MHLKDKFKIPVAVVILMHALPAYAEEKTSEPGAGQCSEVDLSTLLHKPELYAGQLICTRGYFHSRDAWTLHVKKDPNEDEYYDRVALLDTQSGGVERFLNQLADGELLSLEGIMTFDQGCFEAFEKLSTVEDQDLCVPFQRPIFIDVVRAPLLVGRPLGADQDSQ